ncbi:SIR2 family protein [Oceanobacillus caeni]|uniref:SIR2 family protein n=1 Tax=Oceanobacillus caeni TaxID=405946 RepID=UPI00195633CD
MMDIEQKLVEHLMDMDTAPFLFIGSGFSRRYLGLEDWEGLLDRFSKSVNKDFDYYLSTARNNLAKVAELIAEDFHEVWWKEEKYSASREEFKGRIPSTHSALKIEISKYLRDIKYIYTKDKKLDIEIQELKKAVIDGIITTNWDTLLEQIFLESDMNVYIGQKELLFSQPLEVNEIYKIHGCCSVPESLVLTSDDYRDFNDRNAYLAAKLLTIFIEHPVIFIGYSISDENIHKILSAITACLDSDNIDRLKDRLIFVERAKGQADSFESSSMTINQLTLPITRIKTDNYDLVYKALAKNKRKYSMKVIRQIKSQIYELVKTNDPTEKIHVVDYDENGNLDDIEFVIGVGVKSIVSNNQPQNEISSTSEFANKGYDMLSDYDLFREILSSDQNYDYKEIVTKTLPEKLKTNHSIPVNKYVALSKLKPGDLDYKIEKKINMKYKEFLTQKQKDDLEDFAIQWQFTSISQILEGYANTNKVIEVIPLLGEQHLNSVDLKDFISKNMHLLENTDVVGSNFRKLIRIYDWLVYNKNIER